MMLFGIHFGLRILLFSIFSFFFAYTVIPDNNNSSSKNVLRHGDEILHLIYGDSENFLTLLHNNSLTSSQNSSEEDDMHNSLFDHVFFLHRQINEENKCHYFVSYVNSMRDYTKLLKSSCDYGSPSLSFNDKSLTLLYSDSRGLFRLDFDDKNTPVLFYKISLPKNYDYILSLHSTHERGVFIINLFSFIMNESSLFLYDVMENTFKHFMSDTYDIYDIELSFDGHYTAYIRRSESLDLMNSFINNLYIYDNIVKKDMTSFYWLGKNYSSLLWLSQDRLIFTNEKDKISKIYTSSFDKNAVNTLADVKGDCKLVKLASKDNKFILALSQVFDIENTSIGPKVVIRGGIKYFDVANKLFYNSVINEDILHVA